MSIKVDNKSKPPKLTISSKGTPGRSATISIGVTETLPASSAASVTNTGDGTNAVLNFGIPTGNNGWTPVLAVAIDQTRRVLEVVEWVGGDGTQPDVRGYVGATGIVSDIAEAIDIRGPEGLGGGDMLASIYDPNGKAVDVFSMSNMAEGSDAKIMTAAERDAIAANTSARHTHSNKSILDSTTASFTTGLKTKLDGIPADADKTPGIATSSANGLMSSADKITVDGLPSALAATEKTANKGAANGYASLDAAGKIPSAQLPPVAITDTFVVNSQAAMLALTVQVGDIAVRTDLTKTFILRAEPGSVLANWTELLTPPSAVISVNGETGAVTVTKSMVGLPNADNTSDANKPVSTAQAAAIALKITKSGDTGLGGFASFVHFFGSSNGQTFVVDRGTSNFKLINNNGPFVLQAPDDIWATFAIMVWPLAGAGALTAVGFNRVTGTFDPTKGNRLYITSFGNQSFLDIKASD